MKVALSIFVIAFFLFLPACTNEKPKTKSSRADQADLSKASGYYGAVFRARESATRQLGKVQKIRSEQVEEEKEFDRPTQRKPKSDDQP
jgi:hypothetical protein